MAADRSFWHKGLRVDVYAKSFKWTGLPFTVFLGHAPDDDKIRKMIDTAQRPVLRGTVGRKPSLWQRFLDARRRDRLCQCPPPFIPQRNGTCGVCARPEP